MWETDSKAEEDVFIIYEKPSKKKMSSLRDILRNKKTEYENDKMLAIYSNIMTL